MREGGGSGDGSGGGVSNYKKNASLNWFINQDYTEVATQMTIFLTNTLKTKLLRYIIRRNKNKYLNNKF